MLADVELCCPASGEPLELVGDELRTATRVYRIVDGVPILLESSSVFSLDGAGAPESTRRRLAKRLTPRRSPSRGTADRYRRFVALLPKPATVLVVGGGNLGMGADVLLAARETRVIETDVYIGPRTQVVCDGHALPFPDQTFDGVVIQAVLEHVLDPVQVVSEIHRVLRPEGLVFAQTPFMQQVHEGPYDFTRWTESGHRRLFRMFDERERGATAGPAVALLWSLIYLARSLARTPTAQAIAERLVLWTFFWLKPLDRLVVDTPSGNDGASGVYFIGSKRPTPVSDRAVIDSYRGSIGRAQRAIS